MIRKVIQKYNKLYNSALASSNTEVCSLDRIRDYHPSSSPYCGLENAYEIMLNGGPVFKNEMPAMMDYYCSVGTVVHEHLQKWLSRTNYEDVYMIGDLLCKHCGHKIEYTEYQDCPKCGRQMFYEELSVKFGLNTVGHVDCLLHVEIDGKPYKIVVDFKTSSTKAIQLHNQLGKFPYKHNVFQIETYVALLEDQYRDKGLEIDGWLLCYLARDDPSKFVPVGEMVTEKKKKRLHDQIAMWDKQNYYVYKKIRTVPEVFDFKLLKPLVEHKLCPSQKFYEERVKEYEGCPLEKYCFGDGLVKHLKEVHANIKPSVTTVVHCKKEDYDVYIGRKHKSGLPQSIYANPFVIGVDGTHAEVVEKYREWLNGKIVTGKKPPSVQEILLLKGLKLGCWCKDTDPCHGKVLAEICNNFRH